MKAKKLQLEEAEGLVEGRAADLQAKKAELGAAFDAAAGALLAEGIEVGFSADVKSGFKVGEKNGGYYISFSDESFEALLGGYRYGIAYAQRIKVVCRVLILRVIHFIYCKHYGLLGAAQ